MSKCKSCGAGIIWVKMESGKAMPLDAKETLLWKPVREGMSPIQVKGHQSHFSTCPNADSHRKKK